jgi:hypothetical protein
MQNALKANLALTAAHRYTKMSQSKIGARDAFRQLLPEASIDITAANTFGIQLVDTQVADSHVNEVLHGSIVEP